MGRAGGEGKCGSPVDWGLSDPAVGSPPGAMRHGDGRGDGQKGWRAMKETSGSVWVSWDGCQAEELAPGQTPSKERWELVQRRNPWNIEWVDLLVPPDDKKR